MKKISFLLPALLFLFTTCMQPEHQGKKPILIHSLQDALTSAIVHDGFTPPVAARIYAYASVAAYEAIRMNDSLPSLLQKLNGFQFELPQETKSINPRAVMVSAFCKIAVEMVYRDYIIDSIKQKCTEVLKQESGKAELERSEALGIELAEQILKVAPKDGYKETRNMPRFTPATINGHWEPTPPTFTDAIEPYWKLIRPFALDSASQFILPPPSAFGITSDSPLYKDALEVMKTQEEGDTAQLIISEYWDCNPLRTYVKGHIMYNKRQLTPGGHWMAISKYCCRIVNYSEAQSAQVYVLTAIALHDAFISCWEGKYRNDYIRPETYINKYIDKTWKPKIETPPFPEYPSGHSVISASAATVLSEIFGDTFSFTDSAEIPFGKAPRTFYSFRDASNEAARSRITGGIHFSPACYNGIDLGNMVGETVVQKLLKN